MKIDITQPLPCPSCGAETAQMGETDSNGNELYWCMGGSKCGLQFASLTLHELNRLSLLALLGELDFWVASVAEGWRDEWLEDGHPLFDEWHCERDAVIELLKELEATLCLKRRPSSHGPIVVAEMEDQ